MSERLRVLLVEDNPADTDLIRETLPETGPVTFRLACVERLSEALARLEQEVFDLVLLDLGLPDSQGLATYSRLQEVAPRVPLIVLTGNDDEELAIAAVRLGAQDYLIKGQVVGKLLARSARYAVERKRAAETEELSTKRTQALLQLHQMTDATLKQLTDFALEEAVRLTRSTIGYLAFLNEDESVLTMHAWSKSAMAECAITEKPIVYPVASTGLWGEAVRQRGPVITNDYAAANPLKKGYPEGHVAVTRHMNTPVFVGSRIVLVAGVGNKADDYDAGDVQQLTLFMAGMWRLIERQRAAQALQESQALLAQAEEMGKVGGWEFDLETMLQTWTKAVYDIHELDSTGRPTVDQGVNFYTSASRPIIERAVRRAIEQGEPFDVELDIITAKGNPRSVHVIGKADPARRKVSGFFQDITERKRAEDALRIKNQVFEDSIASQSVADRNGVITLVNRAFLLMWGYAAKEEAVGKSVGSFFANPADATSVLEALAAHDAWEGRFLARRTDGSTFSSHGYATSLRGPAGELIGYQSTNLDVTPILESERQLKAVNEDLARSNDALFKNREYLEEAQRIAHVGSWHLDVASNQVVWSDELYQMYGFDPALPPPPYTEHQKLFTPESWARLSTALPQTQATGIPYELELEMVRKDGGQGWMWVRGEAVLDASGATVGLRGTAQDITERKRAEAALLAEKQNLDALFESSPIALLLLDATTQIVRVNEAAVALTGGSEAEFLQHRPGNALRCVHSTKDPRGCGFAPECPLCPVRNGIEALIKSGGSMHGAELPLELKRGGAPQQVWMHLGAEAVMISGARHLLVAMDDVTDRKRAEDGIRTLNAELEQRVVERTGQLEATNTELEAFSYSVSHDLRAPLRHVQGYVDMLGREAGGQLSEDSRRYLKTIADASREMGVLIDDLLAFSRMGRAEMLESSVDLDALVRETRRDLEPVTRGRNIGWSIPPLPAVQADPAMLKLVLANLLGNAVKFTRPRDPAQIEIGCDGTEDGRVILFLRDNGVGFDPQYAHKLFGVFQRLHHTDEFEGTGIGLANVRRIITRHGGRTWAEGAVDKGATFYFTLRAAN